MQEQPIDSPATPEDSDSGGVPESAPPPPPPEARAEGQAAVPDAASASTPAPPRDPTPDAPSGSAAEEEDAAEAAGRAEFAAMLDRSLEGPAAKPPKEVKVGSRVRGRIVSIGGDSAFVDFGGRGEGALPLAQIQDSEGNPKYKVGDTVEASVTSVEGQIALALAVRRLDAGLQVLMKAKEDGTPVEGKVKGTNSGGFEVVLGGVRGFCPFSQMDLGPVGDGQQFIGQVLPFKVLDVSEKGRRVVLSRKALLKGERAKQAVELRHTLAPGLETEGTITRLLPFGAFVDIGGVQGLVHVSEISHRRVGDPSEALAVGQKVKVKVLKLEHLGEGKKERISLSIKAAGADPWQELEGRLKEGDVVRGAVLRVMDFGAFVEVLPGVDGLVHVSQLARRRIAHPRDVVAVGQEIEAKVTKIDPAARRISLSMAALEVPTPGEASGGEVERGEGREGGREGRGGEGRGGEGRGGEGRGGEGRGGEGRSGSRGGRGGRAREGRHRDDGEGRGGRGGRAREGRGTGGGGREMRWESRREDRGDGPPSDSVFAEAFRRARERKGEE